MELKNLELIHALVSDPHLSRAADRFHTTQSALSKRVAQIEDEIGLKLFERRGPRGLHPYPEAREFAASAEKILSTWNASLTRVRNLAQDPEHFVLVGPQLFLREVIRPWWTQAQSSFPKLTFEMRVSNFSRMSVEAIQAEADAAILEHREDISDYICKLVFQEKWGLIRHPQGARPKLKDYVWGTYSLVDNPVERWLIRTQRMPEPSFKVLWQDLTALGLWVAGTPGAATVLPWHAVEWLVDRKQVVFEDTLKNPKVPLYLAYPVGSRHEKIISALGQGLA